MSSHNSVILIENINRQNNNIRKSNPRKIEIWTNSEVERLIAFIKDHPALYNYKLREHFRRRTLLEDLWTDIDIELNKPPGLSKEKYVSLRKTLNKQHKFFLHTGEKGKWPLYESLEFLIPFLGIRKSKRPKLSELENNKTFDLPRNDENSSSSKEDEFDVADHSDPNDGEITLLSVPDTNPPHELEQDVEIDEQSFRTIFSFAPTDILKMPPPVPVTPSKSYPSTSKLEITVLTPGAARFQNGINDVSSQISQTLGEDRLLDFADMEEPTHSSWQDRPQSSRIEKPQPEKFKVPIIKKESLSFDAHRRKTYRMSAKVSKPQTPQPVIKRRLISHGDNQTMMRSYCETMAQNENNGNVSYSVCESITVNGGVQQRKSNCVCKMDPDAMFLHSMLPEVKHLSAKAKSEFKMKMAKALFELGYPGADEEEVD